ncbi:hypothetical protein JCM10207_002898 [Rhodosporidiobolus poonsookiae]
MNHLDPHAQLLPPSLLPLLHDCFHSNPPAYFAELEVIWQAIDNWDELQILALQLTRQTAKCEQAYSKELRTLDGIEKKAWCGLWTTSSWRRQRQRAMEARKAEIAVKQLSREIERNWYQFGIYLPEPSNTAIAAPPSYPFVRPRSTAACPTLKHTLRAAGRSIGDFRGRFEDGEGALPMDPEKVSAKEREAVGTAGWDCFAAYERKVARMHAQPKA